MYNNLITQLGHSSEEIQWSINDAKNLYNKGLAVKKRYEKGEISLDEAIEIVSSYKATPYSTAKGKTTTNNKNSGE